MNKYTRYLNPFLKEDLQDKMIFIGGPRQVGKTTLSQNILSGSTNGYLNWDYPDDRQKILKSELPVHEKIIILDEIHKYKNWRSLIKGFYDIHHKDTKFIVTGSARLDHFRKGGDSLMGRYHYYRLHPFTVDELYLLDNKPTIENLLEYGGFPEPLSQLNPRKLRCWQNERLYRIIHDDLKDLTQVKEITQLELLATVLPNKVGSPLSYNAIATDLQSSPKSIQSWIDILDNLYYCFRIAPYGTAKVRAVKKENKLYLWDWSTIKEKDIQFENMVASHLLKYCHLQEDYFGHKMELRFLRDRDKREVDFVVIKNNEPLFAVECKIKDKDLSPHLKYFSERTPINKFFQVHLGQRDYGSESTGRSMPFEKFVNEYLTIKKTE